MPRYSNLLTIFEGSQPAETGAGTGMPGSFPGDDENPYRTAHIDPRVDSKPSSPALSAAKSSVQATQPSTGTKVERRSSPDPSLQKETDDSHKGRNAGIGAAALGALGLGGYKAKKHDEEKANATSAPSDQPPRPTTTDTRTPSSKTANAPNSTTVQIAPDSKESPSTTDKSLTTKSSDNEKDHHYGRDAGIVGAAVGAVGLGSYETKRQSDQKNSDAGEQGPGPLGINATPSSQDTKPSDIVGQARMDMAGPGGLDDQRYDPSGTSKQHITPVGTFDRPQRDPVLQGTPSTHSGLERDTHHHGRDAGLAAGVGAAGLGAYETKKTYDSQTQPSAQRTSRENLEHEGPLSAGAPPDQMSLPRHNRGDSKSTLDDATATLLRRNADVERSPSRSASEGTQKPAQAEGGVDAGIEPPSYPNPIFRQEEATQQQDKEDDHTARNTAIGAASLDAGAYGAKKLSDLSEPDQLRADSQVPGSQSDDWPLKDSSATEAASIPPSYSTDSYDKANERAQPPEKYDHTARNAALAGAAGVGAGAYAGHEYSQHEAEKLEKERVKQQKAHEKELEKEQTQQQKASDKAAGKEAKKHEKEVAKEEKHAKKEAAKAEKKHEKEIAAQEKEQEKFGRAHEKEIADQEKEREKVEKAREQEALEAEKRHSKEVGIVAGEIPEEQKAPTSPSNKSVSSHGEEKKRHGLRRVLHKIAHPSEKEEDQVPDSPSSSHHEGRHKLHKDPPKGRYSGDDQTPSYADYAVKENEHQGAQTIRGGYTAPDVSEDPNKYPPGHAEETSPLMDKEAHFLSERFADHNIEDRVHHDTPSTATPKGS